MNPLCRKGFSAFQAKCFLGNKKEEMVDQVILRVTEHYGKNVTSAAISHRSFSDLRVTVRQSPLEKSNALKELFPHRWKAVATEKFDQRSPPFLLLNSSKKFRLKCSRRYRLTEVISLNAFTLILDKKIHRFLILDTFCDYPQA